MRRLSGVILVGEEIEGGHFGQVRRYTAVLTSNGVFRKVSDTQFIIIVDNDTMVYITYPKFKDAVVHQIPERYYGIHNVPKILLWYIITKYHNMLPRYLKENQTPLITSWHFLFICF